MHTARQDYLLHIYRPRSEGDNVLGSVRPSVRPSARSRLNRQRAKKNDYQSKVYVCVSNGRADAVDRLLILWCARLPRHPSFLL